MLFDIDPTTYDQCVIAAELIKPNIIGQFNSVGCRCGRIVFSRDDPFINGTVCIDIGVTQRFDRSGWRATLYGPAERP